MSERKNTCERGGNNSMEFFFGGGCDWVGRWDVGMDGGCLGCQNSVS